MTTLSLIFGLVALIAICWFAIKAGLLTRGQDDTNKTEDDARIDTITDELDVQEMKTRKVRAAS